MARGFLLRRVQKPAGGREASGGLGGHSSGGEGRLEAVQPMQEHCLDLERLQSYDVQVSRM